MTHPPILEDAPPAPGRIFTFYSYKGGTGRSMALANVAWILASNGQRVLVVDWDFEAPGLHRYFRPFLPDAELAESPGLIDFFVHFTEAARLQAARAESYAAERPWYLDRADLSRYAVPLDHEFPNDGLLDFVGAGQQGPSYGARVNSFQWGEFYDRLGGGTFLEAVKARLREQYDWVLIDSRTGLSDTSGICTVQMPDELVVCFTLNRQSIFGAAATAGSADAQRRLPDGRIGLRIWPVPTRVELHEKRALEAARRLARERFASFLWHVPPAERAEYLSDAEVLYFPFYAYEEVLATIADESRQRTSLLTSMERLTARLTRGEVRATPPLTRAERERLLERFQPSPERRKAPGFFLSYAVADGSEGLVRQIAQALNATFGDGTAFWSEDVPLGVDLRKALNEAIDASEAMIVLVGENYGRSMFSPQEVRRALDQGKVVIPVLIHGAGSEHMPERIRSLNHVMLKTDSLREDLGRFVELLRRTMPRLASANAPVEVDPEDPHRGQFGGLAEQGDLRLDAHVADVGDGEWFRLHLAVESRRGVPIGGEVEFHLHPTFRPSVVRVPASDRRAELELVAWGAFTVGAVVAGGATRLELDLSTLPDAPRAFRER